MAGNRSRAAGPRVSSPRRRASFSRRPEARQRVRTNTAAEFLDFASLTHTGEDDPRYRHPTVRQTEAAPLGHRTLRAGAWAGGGCARRHLQPRRDLYECCRLPELQEDTAADICRPCCGRSPVCFLPGSPSSAVPRSASSKRCLEKTPTFFFVRSPTCLCPRRFVIVVLHPRARWMPRNASKNRWSSRRVLARSSQRAGPRARVTTACAGAAVYQHLTFAGSPCSARGWRPQRRVSRTWTKPRTFMVTATVRIGSRGFASNLPLSRHGRSRYFAANGALFPPPQVSSRARRCRVRGSAESEQ